MKNRANIEAYITTWEQMRGEDNDKRNNYRL